MGMAPGPSMGMAPGPSMGMPGLPGPSMGMPGPTMGMPRAEYGRGARAGRRAAAVQRCGRQTYWREWICLNEDCAEARLQL